eukprot:COSAG02_NODE_1540_length_12016_cov_20.828480_3_plen_394_part_00
MSVAADEADDRPRRSKRRRSTGQKPARSQCAVSGCTHRADRVHQRGCSCTRCQPQVLNVECFGTAQGTAVHLGGALPGRPPFGSPRPFSLLRGRLTHELTDFLAADPVVRLLVDTPRDSCHPDARHRGHKAATYHAVGSSCHGRWSKTSVDLTGFDHDGLHPPTGPRLHAFAAAFRHANSHALQTLEANLQGMAAAGEAGPGAQHAGTQILPSFQERVFGSCTVQHFVAPLDHRPDGLVLDYHIDSGASALHLAVSLGGVRRLRLRRLSNAGGLSDEGITVEEELLMQRGDVYLSSPSAFAHAVHRGATTCEQRLVQSQMDLTVPSAAEADTMRAADAIAIQFRIAVPAPLMSRFEGNTALLRVIAEAISCHEAEGLAFRLPCLEEVLARLPS